MFNIRLCVKIVDEMAKIADPDQTAPKEQSDHGLQCLYRNLGSFW